MTAPLRLAAFGLAAVVVLGGGAALGAAAGPAPSSTPAVHADHEESPMSSTTLTPSNHTGHAQAADAIAATGEHRLETDSTVIAAGEARQFSFRVIGPDGVPLAGFEDRHERPMHLIVVSTDLTGYFHLHPQLAQDGTWNVELPALVPGGYRMIADTVPTGGPDLALTLDLVVPGGSERRSMPEPVGSVTVDDLDVALDLTATAGGRIAELTVRRDGAVVEPDPYLGARGHLVAIDADDLGYLHVHPEDGDGSESVSFAVADPAPGRYRLFFDFSVDGQVRTAAFTVDIAATTTATAPADAHTHAEGEDHR